MDNTQTSLPLRPVSVPSVVVRAHARPRPLWLSRTIAAIEMVFICGIPTQLVVAAALIIFVEMPFYDDAGRLSLQFIAMVSLIDTALIAVLLRAFLERGGETSRSVFLGTRPLGREVVRGLAYLPVVFLAVTGVVLGLRYIAPWLHTVKQSPFDAYFGSPLDAAIMLAVVVLAGGVREELQRAFILHRTGQHFGGVGFADGRYLGLLLYSPLFAILHYDQGLDIVVAVGLLGLFWGMTYMRRRSVVTGMVNHAGFNAGQVIAAAAARSFGM